MVVLRLSGDGETNDKLMRLRFTLEVNNAELLG